MKDANGVYLRCVSVRSARGSGWGLLLGAVGAVCGIERVLLAGLTAGAGTLAGLAGRLCFVGSSTGREGGGRFLSWCEVLVAVLEALGGSGGGRCECCLSL